MIKNKEGNSITKAIQNDREKLVLIKKTPLHPHKFLLWKEDYIGWN